jgi:hypothetical protein
LNIEDGSVPGKKPIMDALKLLAFVAAYFVVARWVLPRLGVPT